MLAAAEMGIINESVQMSEGEARGRIFWLGMHVVLNTTELPRLRALGYEVFNPPYNSDIYDQSAVTNWDAEQDSTLPRLIFDALRNYNFFYNRISESIGEILNTYFDTIVVTINPDWLREVLRVFKGRIIYRTYGQTGTLSEALQARNCWRAIEERDEFYFVPFCEEIVEAEQEWLRSRSRIVPYTTALDVFGNFDTWAGSSKIDELMVNVPNIANAYYRDMYNHVNANFPGSGYRLYGVQQHVVQDPRVAGTLLRSDLLRAYQHSKGFFYPYHDRNVCYLQPIEMMITGGPVVYHTGSLLDRFLRNRGPGRAGSIDEQRYKNTLMLGGDASFVEEVIASQAEVRRRYSPEYVHPIFDAALHDMLAGGAMSGRAALRFERYEVQGAMGCKGRPRVWCLAHFPGGVFRYEAGQAFASEGIPRVIARVVRALIERNDVVLSTYAHAAIALADMFRDLIDKGQLSLYVLDGVPSIESSTTSDHHHVMLEGISRIHIADEARTSEATGRTTRDVASRLTMVGSIQGDARCVSVFIPHYHLFPEALQISVPTVLYLPDYTPAFFPGVAFGRTVAEDDSNAEVGRLLAARAAAVLTNSEFTRSYLPSSPLQVDPLKVHVATMPLLSGSATHPARIDLAELEQELGGVTYILYPTANRPNKQIAFLLRVFNEIRTYKPEVRLVLTCSIADYAPAQAEFDRLRLSRHVLFYPGVSERTLDWLYDNASVVCLTTTMEGNFPPQIIEALHHHVPIVTTALVQIQETLGEAACHLLTCMPVSQPDFLRAVLQALEHYDEVVDRQAPVLQRLVERNSIERFAAQITDIFSNIA